MKYYLQKSVSLKTSNRHEFGKPFVYKTGFLDSCKTRLFELDFSESRKAVENCLSDLDALFHMYPVT